MGLLDGLANLFVRPDAAGAAGAPKRKFPTAISEEAREAIRALHRSGFDVGMIVEEMAEQGSPVSENTVRRTLKAAEGTKAGDPAAPSPAASAQSPIQVMREHLTLFKELGIIPERDKNPAPPVASPAYDSPEDVLEEQKADLYRDLMKDPEVKSALREELRSELLGGRGRPRSVIAQLTEQVEEARGLLQIVGQDGGDGSGGDTIGRVLRVLEEYAPIARRIFGVTDGEAVPAGAPVVNGQLAPPAAAAPDAAGTPAQGAAPHEGGGPAPAEYTGPRFLVFFTPEQVQYLLAMESAIDAAEKAAEHISGIVGTLDDTARERMLNELAEFVEHPQIYAQSQAWKLSSDPNWRPLRPTLEAKRDWLINFVDKLGVLLEPLVGLDGDETEDEAVTP